MSTSPIRVVAAVVQRRDALLVCQRPAHKRHGGLWEFPGGKCEQNETDDEAVRRELTEELDVEVASVGPELFSIADPESPYLIVFLPAEIRGEPRAIEHDALRWDSLEHLTQLPLAPSDRRFVEFLLSTQ